MDPVRFSVSRPYTVAVGVILVLIFSVLAYQRIPVQLKPTVDQPIISVQTIYRGAGAIEVEEAVTRRIEDLLQGAEGLDKLTSSSIEGFSTVTLQYDWGVDKDRAVIDVINKLSQLEGMPEDAEEPVVSLTGMRGAEFAMWIRTRSPYSADRVRRIVEDEVVPRLERVPGVSDLLVLGGEEREIRVLVDPDRLAARGVTFDELAQALRRGHLDRRGGTLETANRQLVVRTEGRTADPTSIEAIVVRRDRNGTVRVGDVARVHDGYRERTSIVHADGEDVVVMGARRQVGSNVVTMIEGVDREIGVLNDRFAEDGVDLRLATVYRDTTYLEQALSFVRQNLLLGAALAVLVLLVFLRSLRSVLVVALAIPISLVTVFLVMDSLGRTLNVVSLAGLAFAAGMVVDNAIVVLENIFRKLEVGLPAREAAGEGGREVWGGVLASTLTTIAVFIPILGIEEEAGQLFRDLAIAISAAVAISLAVALTVVPTLAAILYGRRGRERARRPGFTARLYGRAAEALASPGGPHVLQKLALVVLVVAASIATLRIVPPAGYLPRGNANLVFYFGQPIPGTRPETLMRHLRSLEDWIQAQPTTGRYFTIAAPLFNGGGVILKEAYADGPHLDDYLQRMMPVCLSIPGFRYLFPVRASLFRDSGKQFTVEITGPDLDELGAVARTLQETLGQWPGVQPRGIQSDFVEGRPELKVEVDPHLAGEAGLSVAQVGSIVETTLAGRIVGTFSDGGRDYDVTLVVPPERVKSPEDLAALPISTPVAGRTTLGAVARLARKTGPQSVNRLERERAITLTVNLEGDAVLQAVLEDVQARVLDPLLATLPAGIHVELGGSADKLTATLAALTGGLWLAVLITYLLLVALFRSWIAPFVILVSVPLAMTGGLLGVTIAHTLRADATFDVLSMLGFVILTGIVVNNAILILHQMNNLRDEGMDRRRALAEAAQSRFRPILMSVTTTVFGMLPLAIGRGAGAELYQGLAAVVVGGLLLSTVFTLFLVPALVSLGWDVAEAFARRSVEPERDGGGLEGSGTG